MVRVNFPSDNILRLCRFIMTLVIDTHVAVSDGKRHNNVQMRADVLKLSCLVPLFPRHVHEYRITKHRSTTTAQAAIRYQVNYTLALEAGDQRYERSCSLLSLLRRALAALHDDCKHCLRTGSCDHAFQMNRKHGILFTTKQKISRKQKLDNGSSIVTW